MSIEHQWYFHLNFGMRNWKYNFERITVDKIQARMESNCNFIMSTTLRPEESVPTPLSLFLPSGYVCHEHIVLADSFECCYCSRLPCLKCTPANYRRICSLLLKNVAVAFSRKKNCVSTNCNKYKMRDRGGNWERKRRLKQMLILFDHMCLIRDSQCDQMME